MSSAPWNAEIKDALRAERVFHPGQVIRWNPPPRAYSSQSLQGQLAGQSGIVERIYNDNDSYLFATPRWATGPVCYSIPISWRLYEK